MSDIPSAVIVPRRRGALGPAFLRTSRGKVGLTMLAFVLAVALIGPLVAPHALDEPIGVPGSPPFGDAPLGTDFLGRDVLSRLLHGGLPVLALAFASVVATYVVGTTIGMLAALSGGWVDSAIMRTVDLFIVFPPMLLLLVLVAGGGTSWLVLLAGLVLVLAPGVARLVRTAALEVSTTSFVEAAVARGERLPAIMRREVLPNILPPIVADAGTRFSSAVFIVASLNFLGLGSQPPAANWGLMIAENRTIIATNVWALVAPAVMIGLLAVSLNIIGDAYVQSLGRSARKSKRGLTR